jgi:exosortase/archaeosortase family protein
VRHDPLGTRVSSYGKKEMILRKVTLFFTEHRGLSGGLLFLLLLAGSCWILSIYGDRDNFEQIVASHSASMASRILTLLGMSANASGNSIFSHEFNINIGPACSAFFETIVFSAAIVAYPMKIKDKILGVLLGAAEVWVTNLLRVIVLFLVGVYFPNLFDVLHDHVIQAIFILFMVVLWIFWISKSSAKRIATH